jgi:hypothetical protein
MHKAKGKEFDNVFLLLNRYPQSAEEKKRVLICRDDPGKREPLHSCQFHFISHEKELKIVEYREDPKGTGRHQGRSYCNVE